MSAIEDRELLSGPAPTALFAGMRRPATVPVLLADPDLAAVLPPAALRTAAAAARARTLRLDPGRWEPTAHGDAGGAIGLLVLDGVVCRSVIVGGERSSELLGTGDILRPWTGDDAPSVPADLEYEVLAPAEIAILDRGFARAIAPWPELIGELVDRALRRSRSLAVLSATSHIKRVDVRLLALLWHVADRWGRVTPDGVVVPLRLTHATLAALVGAQRPSVTTALSRMSQRGVLQRSEAGHFVLAGAARDELNELCLASDARRTRLRRVDLCGG